MAAQILNSMIEIKIYIFALIRAGQISTCFAFLGDMLSKHEKINKQKYIAARPAKTRHIMLVSSLIINFISSSFINYFSF